MKKILLLAAAAMVAAGTVNAQEYVNHVVNGSFDQEGWEQSVPGGYTWAPWNEQQYLTVLPGWSLSTGGEWNGGVEMLSGTDWEGDGEYRDEDDTNLLRFLGYNDNGWTKIAIYQVVEGLTAGREYTFNYLYAEKQPEGAAWTPDPNFGFQIAEADKNAEGADIAGKEILNVNIAENNDEWENGSIDLIPTKDYTFTAPADGKVYLQIYLGNYYDKNNKHDNLWMLIDNVKMFSEEEEAGISEIVADENAPVEYFNLQGVRVANPENGMFIRRQGSKAEKVAL
ncbi:MAG: hypothetical protein K2F63_04155 [Muribaculaceae bacterium]|nr:hypothetical protein [Muribaculaceae bacterium]